MNQTGFEDINKHGSNLEQRFAFIPHRLDIKDRPEFSNFPFNILFISYKTDGIRTISGKAIYLPKLDTYRVDGETQRLDYFNQYAPGNTITISFRPDTGWYKGNKIIGGERITFTIGRGWKEFFIHLTAGGLVKGEGCLFKDET